MTEPTGDSSGASQSDATQVDKTPGKPKAPGRDPILTERDKLLQRMDEQIDAQRKSEEEEFLASAGENPQAWLLHKRMQAEAKGQPLDTETPPETDEEPADLEDGTESVERVAAPVVAEKREAQRISNKGEDPLGEYVVRVNGKPMFKTLVDGQEKLIPLEAARAQLQKHLAADIRLQNIAAQRKELDARAAQLQRTEAELAARPRQPAQPVVDDSALDKEAIELVRSLVTDTEDKAAARLAQTLKTIRQANQPQIDVEAIRKEAVATAKQTLAEDKATTALETGFDTFTQEYRDIASDPELFAIADRKTDAIAAEHPEWSPGKVMLEAGKQTREWLKSIGAPVKAVPNTNGQQPSNRQQRKEGLRLMPAARVARPAPVQSDSEGRQSPAEVVAEMRKSRGQWS